ncbi:MAG: AmmeMemoRadiSam system protein B [bacterium]|nr:AmmeMemoRadiSam system protein B [bacterium]
MVSIIGGCQMKRLGIILALAVVAVSGMAAFALSLRSVPELPLILLPAPREDDDTRLEPFPPQFRNEELFKNVFEGASSTIPQASITGIIVPHHLLAADVIAKTFATARNGAYDTVIVMSPDHFYSGKTNISVAEEDFSTVFGALSTNRQIVSAITNNNPNALTQEFFYREHGIGGITPFVKHYFPNVSIVAITLKTGMPVVALDDLIVRLKPFVNERTLIVQSTDFSHYLPASEAAQKDEETMQVIAKGEPKDYFTLKEPAHIDSRAAAYVQWSLQQQVYGARPEIFIHKNSQDYTKEFIESTTSYIAQIFRRNVDHQNSLLFVGDIMLGRSVETLMDRHGRSYPFDDIVATFKTYGTVVGNLEGPILDPHVQTKDYGMSFSFDKSVAKMLRESGVTHVSLGNNHTANGGQHGLDQTRKFLSAADVASFGDPNHISQTDSITYDSKTDTLLFSIHATTVMPSVDAIRSLIDATKKEHDGALVAALVHWGKEYSPEAVPFQKKLGHLLGDAGADYVIGTHPHVIEPVELYHGKPIFYSLGNFIFDQYFSKETQEGLMIEVVPSEKTVDYRIIPVTIDRSKPRIMDAKSAQAVLDKMHANATFTVAR